jgi:hypothetical protein
MRQKISSAIIFTDSVNDYIALHDLDRELQRAVDSSNTVSWRKWPQDADTSLVRSELHLAYCLEKLAELYLDRQAAKVGAELAQDIIKGPVALKALGEIFNQSNGHGLPPIVSAKNLHAKPPPIPSEIVEGILHQGGKMVIGGGSKSFKTWILLELAVAVATGAPWLGFDTSIGKVLYLNFELPEFAVENRLAEIYEAMEIDAPDNLELWNLRGHAADASLILPRICSEAKALDLGLIIMDPLYKLLGDRDENASRDMANLMNQIERLAVDTRSAIAFGAHFAKGNASLKEAIDRFSGSGVIGRDPDSIITFTQHKKPNAFCVDMILRNFPQQESFVVRRCHPLMAVDANLNPAHLKKIAGRQAEHEPDDLLESLESPMNTKEWIEASDIPERTFYRLLAELKKERKIFKSKMDGKWNRKV